MDTCCAYFRFMIHRNFGFRFNWKIRDLKKVAGYM